MSEVATQLREYFDDVTERITEEDIRLRAGTARATGRPATRFRPRPLAAGAIGFGLATTLIGSVLVMNRLFGGIENEAGGSGPSSPALGESNPWLIVPVAVGVGLLATGIITTLRNTNAKPKGVRTMQTIEQEEPTIVVDDEILHLRKRNRGLGWLLGILAVAVIGLGAWLIVELTSSDGTSLPSEVQAALDDYEAAWETGDAATFLASTTDDYTFMSNGGTEFSKFQQSAVISLGDAFSFQVDPVETTVIGDGPYFIGQSEVAHYTGAPPEGYQGQSTYVIVDVDGWKIQRHVWMGEDG